jgi:hypothetical protein
MNLTSPEDTKQEEQNTDVPLVTRTAALNPNRVDHGEEEEEDEKMTIRTTPLH